MPARQSPPRPCTGPHARDTQRDMHANASGSSDPLDERAALTAHLFGLGFAAVIIVSLSLTLTVLIRWSISA
ncbi:hypothetical protein [Paraburkholderia sp. BL10I2N1]|uniref:hypothetical protein n=1 Tax=Paraburkholderia sp. BL10I2N1 TaxID=1938796 RepID=UPI00105CEB8A|nr:hypothetical protein [Paraburkholderia sp. BL10I2N1]TDN61120.1 hypothetical protein B0G77_4540 [Paraburkholderia sp. BL10I2N1]